MSIHNVQAEAQKSAMASRPCSRSLWENCPELDIMINPMRGFIFLDHFLKMGAGATGTTVDGWRLTQAGSAGTFAPSDEIGGVALLDAADSDNGDGAQIQTGTTVGEIFVPAASIHKTLWFEARVQVDIITDDMFIGLSEVDTSIITTSGVTPSNFIGFSSITGDGVFLSNSEKVDVGDTDTAATIVAGEWTRFGFRISTNRAGVISASFYVDNVLVSHLVAANIPLVALMPSFVMQSSGVAAPVMKIDWVKGIQLT